MGSRLPVFLLLASALTFLASLFLPWRAIQPFRPGFFDAQGHLDLSQGRGVVGWVAGVGDVAVLLVVVLVFATVAVLRRPRLMARLPLGSLGVALAYFAAAVAVMVHAVSALEVRLPSGPVSLPPPHTSWTYGFYLGMASGAAAGLCGLALRWSELRRPRTVDAVAAILGIALLISFLLTWVEFFPSGEPGIASAAAAISALGLILGARWLHTEAGRRWRLPVAIATAILVGAAASAVSYNGIHRYGAWIGVGCAVLLVVLEAARAWPLRLPTVPRGPAALRMGAAALLVVALFLPWQEVSGVPPGPNGWYLVAGVAAGSLCLLLLATPALPALESYVLDAVVAVALFVAALGTAFFGNLPFFQLGYGAFVGFAAAGILLVARLVSFRPRRIEPGRARARIVPLAASVLCVATVVVPSWFVLPPDWTLQASALYGWLSVPRLLLALYLVRLWALRLGGPASTGNRLTLVPLVLLSLAALELIHFRAAEVLWGAVILVGLCILLALCGWIEEHGGLEGLRVPDDIWRVDRLPEPES
jgi:hypothetical protein